MKEVKAFLKTVKKLRKECPWDRAQTHKTLKRYLIEETYEAIEAIDKNDYAGLKEELGDILLQVVLHSQIASEKKRFTFHDLVTTVNKKMISRHPHVFGNLKVKDVSEVLKNWETLKKKERPAKANTFDGIPPSLPALLKAWKVSKKAAKEGFDWKKESELWKAFEKELNEFKTAVKYKNEKEKTEEFGDLLFMIVNIARWYKIDPEDTLNQGISKFIKRYIKVKNLTQASNKEVSKLSSKDLNKYWLQAKKTEK